MPYQTPASDMVSIIDAPPTPIPVMLPGGRFVMLVHYELHPPVRQLARPYLALAGLRVDPAIAGRQRVRRLTGLSVIRLAGGSDATRPIALPADASISVPTFAPDGETFAFTVDEPDGIGVWVGDAAAATVRQVPGLRVRDVLGGDPMTRGATIGWSRDGRSLLALGAPAEPPPLPGEVTEPRIEETAGKHTQMATFTDLLRSPADADAFEALATTVPLRVDPVSGAVTRLGPPGLYRAVTESPDGEYLLVHRTQRPFSFRVPFQFFARRIEVWAAGGGLRRVIADLPVSDEVPRHGVPTGPRQVSWEESSPARLLWTEAQDGGDPRAEAEYRDQITALEAPFDAEPAVAFPVRQRCLGWLDLPEPHRVLLSEHDRDRRWITTWRCDTTDPAANRVIFDQSADDAYGDPGAPLMRLHSDGTRTALCDGSVIYLRGEGATPDGDRPFLDRLDLDQADPADPEQGKTRLFASPADVYERVLGFVADRRDLVLISHENRAEPPNLFLAPLGDGERARLTRWPDPHPQLTGMTKRLVSHDRGDGVQLTGILHLPPGYEPGRGGRLPLVIWAYPLDYGDAGTAGQVRGSTARFTRLQGIEPAWFVLRGYAVLVDATMPVIGDPETMNDTYLEQITAAAAAHIRALDEMGIIDPGRVAVGGHSYGGFMTANLLAHTDLFAAGIARSGAYNRSLTPFGFQTERRSFWEAPQVYDRVSPFRYADQITAPILLIHGAEDANSGTFPIQSERLFQAIQGCGGTARLVLLPNESHGYAARESILHVLAEQFNWLERWFDQARQPAPASAASGAERVTAASVAGTVPAASGAGTAASVPGGGTVPAASGAGEAVAAAGEGTVPAAPGEGTAPAAPGEGTAPAGPGTSAVPPDRAAT